MLTTKLIGFTPLSHEGKLLGLAASGNPEKLKILKNYISLIKKFTIRKLGGYYIKVYNKLKNDLKIFQEKILLQEYRYSEKLTIEYFNNYRKIFL